MNILVDTNIIIEMLRKKDKTSAIYLNLFTAAKNNTPYISFVSIIELYAGTGMDNTNQKKATDMFIETVNILSPTEEVYKTAGELIRTYRIQFQDALIAAQCIVDDLPLLTLNTKHFIQIKELSLFDSSSI